MTEGVDPQRGHGVCSCGVGRDTRRRRRRSNGQSSKCLKVCFHHSLRMLQSYQLAFQQLNEDGIIPPHELAASPHPAASPNPAEARDASLVSPTKSNDKHQTRVDTFTPSQVQLLSRYVRLEGSQQEGFATRLTEEVSDLLVSVPADAHIDANPASSNYKFEHTRDVRGSIGGVPKIVDPGGCPGKHLRRGEYISGLKRSSRTALQCSASKHRGNDFETIDRSIQDVSVVTPQWGNGKSELVNSTHCPSSHCSGRLLIKPFDLINPQCKRQSAPMRDLGGHDTSELNAAEKASLETMSTICDTVNIRNSEEILKLLHPQ